MLAALPGSDHALQFRPLFACLGGVRASMIEIACAGNGFPSGLGKSVSRQLIRLLDLGNGGQEHARVGVERSVIEALCVPLFHNAAAVCGE